MHSPSKYFTNRKFVNWLEYEDPKEGYNLQVISFLNPRKSESILDNGCGNGRFSLEMADKGAKVVSLDVNKFMVQTVKRRAIDRELNQEIDVIIADSQNLPLRDRLFDKVLCVHNLWYIPLYHKAVNEMLRVTKDGGRLIVDQISERIHTRHIWIHGVFYGIHRLIAILSKVGREITPEFFRAPEQFLIPFANYSTRFYSIPLPPLLHEILNIIPLPNAFQGIQSKLWPFLLTEGFNPSAHRWLAVCEKITSRQNTRCQGH